MQSWGGPERGGEGRVAAASVLKPKMEEMVRQSEKCKTFP